VKDKASQISKQTNGFVKRMNKEDDIDVLFQDNKPDRIIIDNDDYRIDIICMS